MKRALTLVGIAAVWVAAACIGSANGWGPAAVSIGLAGMWLNVLAMKQTHE